MSDMEKRVHDAFDAVHAPACVKANALAAIEAKRAELTQCADSEPDGSEGLTASAATTGESSHAGHSVEAARSATSSGNNTRRISGNGESADVRHEERREHSARRGRRGAQPSGEGRSLRKERRGFRLLGAKIAVAACLVLVAFGVGGYAIATPTAYVGIDVNPSIELGINRFDHVVGAKAYNDDGQAVLDQAQVRGMAYADALASIESVMADQGYLAQDSVIEVNVVCDDDNRYASIESTCMNCFSGSGSGAHCSRATADEHHEAASCGMGLGKYRAYQVLSDAGVDITADEASAMTMRELYDLGADAGVEIEWGCGAGHGAGHGSGKGASDGSADAESVDCDDASGAGAQGQGQGQNQGQGAGQASGSGSGQGGQGHGQGHRSGHGMGYGHE